MLGAMFAACSGDDDTQDAASSTAADAAAPTTTTSTTEAGGASTPLTAADFAGLGTCVLLPEATAGPFPLDQQFDRRDVTEGYPGHPLRLGLRVLDAKCAAVSGAAVEIWHADASGDYSAFADNGGGKDEAEGTTFLRGTQTANGDGIVEFLTVYPGWYTGRAPHVHLRVHVDDTMVLTSQLYFDESYTEGVYREAVYAPFGAPDTTNESDGLAGDPLSEGTLLAPRAAVTAIGRGTVALLNLGIDPRARAT